MINNLFGEKVCEIIFRFYEYGRKTSCSQAGVAESSVHLFLFEERYD